MLKGVGADIIHRLGVVCIALSVGKWMPKMEANGGYTVLIFGYIWHVTVSSRRVSLWMGGTAVSGPL